MKYAVISDIHSNFSALEQVLHSIHQHDCDRVICLGDIVGYGPQPNECLDLIRDIADVVIVGNHDFAAAGLTDVRAFNMYARLAAEWTSNELSNEHITYIKSLDLYHAEKNLYFVHASPCSPASWNYIFSLISAKKNFDCFDTKLCFIGHSHIPVIFQRHGLKGISIVHKHQLECMPDERYIVNVGSVGQPRDDNPKASFGVYDDTTRIYELIRTSYDISQTQTLMKSNNLPEYLIQRLSFGR
jgi:predicted phosphodiesterase